jgi:hypothetical protein
VDLLALVPSHLVRPDLARLIETTTLEINNAELLAEGLVPDGLVGGELGGPVAVGVIFGIVDLYSGTDPFLGGKGIKVGLGGREIGQRGGFGEFIGCRERVFLGDGRRSRSRSVGCFGRSELFGVAGSLLRIDVGLLGGDLMLMFVFMFVLMLVVLVLVLVVMLSLGRRCWLNFDDFGDSLDSGCTANSFVYSGDKSRVRSSGFFLGDERRRLVAVGNKCQIELVNVRKEMNKLTLRCCLRLFRWASLGGNAPDREIW